MAKDELQALLDICGCDMVATFESGCYISRIREISFTLLGMNVGWNVCLVIVSVIKQLTNINLAGSFSTASTTEFTCRSPNTCKAMHQWQWWKIIQHCFMMKDQRLEESQILFKWQLVRDFILWDFLTKVLVQLKHFDSIKMFGKSC